MFLLSLISIVSAPKVAYWSGSYTWSHHIMNVIQQHLHCCAPPKKKLEHHPEKKDSMTRRVTSGQLCIIARHSSYRFEYCRCINIL